MLTDPDTERSCPEAYVAGSLLHAEYEATLPNRAGPVAVCELKHTTNYLQRCKVH